LFPRISRVKVGEKCYEYLRVVESFRDEKGRMRQRNVANLGRLEDLAGGKLDALVEKLRRFCQKDFVLPQEIASKESVSWGQVLVARHLWDELGLGGIVKRRCQGDQAFDVAEQAFVLVANRLSEPSSEHGLARWLEHTYVCDRKGERFVPRWLPPEEVTKEQRVKVHWDWLEPWYKTLDAVYEQKKEIEKDIYLRLRDLFSLKVDFVFYDITSFYLERREPVGKLRRHGYSRDGKPRDVQVLLGTVMVAGLPLAAQVFEGNRADRKTVREVVEDIRDRFGLKNVVFVADKGMTSPANVELLQSLQEFHYLLGHPGRRDQDAQTWLKSLQEERWLEGARGTRVQEVPSGQPGVRVFIAESEVRKAYEVQLRARSMARAEAHLKKVATAVAKGRLKRVDKIGARAARALQRDKGHRYFSYRVPAEGQFEYAIDNDKLQAETLHEGRYILTTDQPDLDPREALKRYKELSDVEDGFRSLKDLIRARPIYHRRDERICAHLFIAQLAFLLLRQLRHRLEQANLPLSPRDALAAAKSLGVSILEVNGKTQVLPSSAKRDARRVFTALGVQTLTPPLPTSYSLPQKND